MHWHDQRGHQSMESRKVEHRHRDHHLARSPHHSDQLGDRHCDQRVHYSEQLSMEASREKKRAEQKKQNPTQKVARGKKRKKNVKRTKESTCSWLVDIFTVQSMLPPRCVWCAMHPMHGVQLCIYFTKPCFLLTVRWPANRDLWTLACQQRHHHHYRALLQSY